MRNDPHIHLAALLLTVPCPSWRRTALGRHRHGRHLDRAGAETEAVDPMEPRDAADLTLEEFLWIARPIIVFADTPADPRFIEQMQLLAERPEPLLERDVVIIVDTDPRHARRSARRCARVASGSW
jgi:hypothetical protein